MLELVDFYQIQINISTLTFYSKIQSYNLIIFSEIQKDQNHVQWEVTHPGHVD